jgi:hypothetical protein
MKLNTSLLSLSDVVNNLSLYEICEMVQTLIDINTELQNNLVEMSDESLPTFSKNIMSEIDEQLFYLHLNIKVLNDAIEYHEANTFISPEIDGHNFMYCLN